MSLNKTKIANSKSINW